MKKTLILVSALFLVFACSSDGDTYSNNNSLIKLIESIIVISPSCENTYNLWMFYDNQNRITSFQTKYYQTICDVADEGNFDIVNWQVVYGENVITSRHRKSSIVFQLMKFKQ